MAVATIRRSLEEVLRNEPLASVDDPEGLSAVNEGRRATFESDPLSNDKERLTQILGLVDNEVIGRLNVFPLGIVADGEPLSAVCGDSLLVLEKARNSLYSVSLMTELNNVSADRISLSAGFSAKAQKLIRLIRNVVFPYAKRLVVKKSRYVFSGFGRFHFLVGMAWLADLCLMPYRLLTRTMARCRLRGMECQELGADDAAAIAAFAEMIANDEHRFREDMSAEVIRWMMKNDFHLEQSIVKRLYAYRKGGRFVAFVMTRESRQRNGELGEIIEWQSLPQHRHLERFMILDVMHRLLRRCDCVELDVNAAEARGYDAVTGFLPGIGVPVVSVGVGKDSALKKHAGYEDVANWRIRSGMGDLCFS